MTRNPIPASRKKQHAGTHLCCIVGCTTFISVWGSAGARTPADPQGLPTEGLRWWVGAVGGPSPLLRMGECRLAWLLDLLRTWEKADSKGRTTCHVTVRFTVGGKQTLQHPCPFAKG